jgi:lipoate-protein ligase A
MAADEALLETAAARGRPLLRLYGWETAAVTIGYPQPHAAAPAGWIAIRRPTGGGVVYHDHDVTYTVVVPAGHWLTGTDRLQSYAFINRAVLAGLERLAIAGSLAREDIPGHIDRRTMVCFTTPTRYDILAGDRKLAGSAQRRTRHGILHQGSIHFGGPAPLPREEIRAAVVDGFRRAAGARFEPFTPGPELLALAARLEAERYGTDAWNRRK